MGQGARSDHEEVEVQRVVTLDLSRPGRPTDNAFADSFNGKVLAECLNTTRFMSRAAAPADMFSPSVCETGMSKVVSLGLWTKKGH